MGQIGSHEFEDSTEALTPDASNVGQHAFTQTDNTTAPCNGLDSCTDCPDDAA